MVPSQVPAFDGRTKYPHLMDGVFAASAPVLHFLNDSDHPVDMEAFQRITVFDMSPVAGASDNCIPNARKAVSTLIRLGQTPQGRQIIGKALKLCNPEDLETLDDAQTLVAPTIGMFSTLAMGNYPYPSSYMMDGAVNLPAYPVRAACQHFAPDFGTDDEALLEGLRDAVGVFFNATGNLKCIFPSITQPRL